MSDRLLPSDYQWIDADAITKIMPVTKRYVLERMSRLPGFPKAFRPGGRGYPQWRKDEVIAWVERQRRLAS